MTQDQFSALLVSVNTLNWASVLVTVSATTLFATLGGFFGAYLAEKGKNRAIKEDIREITKNVEIVRVEFTGAIEALKGGYALRAAVQSKMLETHQQAFARWWELTSLAGKRGAGPEIKKHELWWEHNCLYLTPAARDAFTAAVHAAYHHESLIQSNKLPKEIRANFDKVVVLGNIILKEAQIPEIPTLTVDSLIKAKSGSADSDNQ